MKRVVKKALLGITIFAPLLAFCNPNNEHIERDAFVAKLMQKMTTQEKLGQMNLISPYQKTGPFANLNAKDKMKKGIAGNALSITGSMDNVFEHIALAEESNLKIPMLLGLDIIHGYRTVFPIPLGLSCSWDTEMVEKTARVAAIEGTSMGYKWTFSPMVDISRDPRWGRVMEGFGEDPYLAGEMARAMVQGYQGDDLSSETSLLACVKHFALYGASEAGRDYNTADMSRLSMYNDYFGPYKAAVEAGAGSVMTSFNLIDGVPATANRWLLTEVLRNEWGFDGFVVTDMNAMQELVPHGVAADSKQAGELALNAGVDMDMGSECFVGYFEKSLAEGKITTDQIDASCRRVLEVKYDLGLFNDYYKKFDKSRYSKVVLSKENKELAKEAALKSVVLLKNKGVLPLKRDSKIALIGPFANSQPEMISMWAFTGDVESVVSIYEGLRKKADNVVYAQGTQLTDHKYTLKRIGLSFDTAEQEKQEQEALLLAEKSDVIVVMLGESKSMFGEGKSRSEISIPDCQKELLKELKKTGKPIVLLLANGRPLTIANEVDLADSVLEIWQLGTMAGDAVADILFGDYNPSGKLTMSFPRNVGQIPVYYNHKNTGRPYEDGSRVKNYLSNYIDEQNSPLFPFGYGLSYTQFDYSEIALSSSSLSGDDAVLNATVKVTNTGQYAGEETVQLYIADPVASISRPVKELKHFAKVFLAPGETKEVAFPITSKNLCFYNSDYKFDWESGEFVIYIGTNSLDVKEARITWEK